VCGAQVHNPTALLLDRAITPVWYIVGIIGNTLSACVWLQRRMWSSNSSAVYLATISIADLIFLLLHILQVENTFLVCCHLSHSTCCKNELAEKSFKLEARHSIKCITHADRAAPSRRVASQWSETAPHGCLVATFYTFWPCDLDLWPFYLILIGERGIVIDYPCAEFDDFSFSRFSRRADRQTDRHTDRWEWLLYSRDYRLCATTKYSEVSVYNNIKIKFFLLFCFLVQMSWLYSLRSQNSISSRYSQWRPVKCRKSNYCFLEFGYRQTYGHTSWAVGW